MVNRDVESAKTTSSLEWRRPGSSSDGIVKKEKKGGKMVAERMQLFRRAFTSRICDRHLLYPPLYIPGTVLHPSYPPAASFSSYNHHLNPHKPTAFSRGQGVSAGTSTHRLQPWSTLESFVRNSFFIFTRE